MRVLIVDDDFYSRSFLEYLLHPYAACEAAVNGEEAVMMFHRALSDGQGFDLVCLDLLMPVIDGPRALREIREVEKDHGLGREGQCKILITSVLEDGEDTHNAMYLGDATSFLQKPIEEKALLAELKKMGLMV